jgi:hypothetical protein
MEINRVISRGPVFRENKPSLSKLGTLNYILRDKGLDSGSMPFV